jgi:MFS family permease
VRPGRLEYKWVALTNTTLGMLMATINASILLIALPDIFRGIHLDPLAPGNTSYLLWLILGFLVATAVLVVSLGRLGDIYGRVRMFNLGFAVFTAFSILLSIMWMHGSAAALWLIVMRVGQGVGGALLFANSSAILTDAFPHDQRGLALGVNSIAAIAGSFLGLVLGGCWRRCHGGSSSSSRFLSDCSRPSGRTTHCVTWASAGRRGSTGGATRPLHSGSWA